MECNYIENISYQWDIYPHYIPHFISISKHGSPFIQSIYKKGAS